MKITQDYCHKIKNFGYCYYGYIYTEQAQFQLLSDIKIYVKTNLLALPSQRCNEHPTSFLKQKLQS